MYELPISFVYFVALLAYRGGGRSTLSEGRGGCECRSHGDIGAEASWHVQHSSRTSCPAHQASDHGLRVVRGEAEFVGRHVAGGAGLGVWAATIAGPSELLRRARWQQLLPARHGAVACQLGLQRLLPNPQCHQRCLRLSGHGHASLRGSQ